MLYFDKCLRLHSKALQNEKEVKRQRDKGMERDIRNIFSKNVVFHKNQLRN